MTDAGEPDRPNRPVSRTYLVWCPGCGAEWPELDADDTSLLPGEAVALCACEHCSQVSRVVVKQSAAELERLRRQIDKTVQKMCQSFVRAQGRLEERRRTLAREIGKGRTEQVDPLRDLEARIAALRPPDTSALEARARELDEAARSAPRRVSTLPCPQCGQSAAVHRESHRGYSVPCPTCEHKLIVQLKLRR